MEQGAKEEQYYFPNESPVMDFVGVTLKVLPYHFDVFVDYFNHSGGFPLPQKKEFKVKKGTQPSSVEQFLACRKRAIKKLCDNEAFDRAWFLSDGGFLSKKFWEMNIRWLGFQSYQQNALIAARFIKENYPRNDNSRQIRMSRERAAEEMQTVDNSLRQFFLTHNDDTSHAIDSDRPPVKFKSQLRVVLPATKEGRKVLELNDAVLSSVRRVKKLELQEKEPQLYTQVQSIREASKKSTSAQFKPQSKQRYRKPTRMSGIARNSKRIGQESGMDWEQLGKALSTLGTRPKNLK